MFGLYLYFNTCNNLYHHICYVEIWLSQTPRTILLNGLTLIPAWISNYIRYKAWDEITFDLLFDMDVSIYPCPKLSAGSGKLCQ